jgi:hypothetical protein
MARIEVDASAIPLVVVVYPSRVNRAELEEAMAHYVALSRRHARIGYLIDFRKFDPVFADADVRREAARIFARHVDDIAPSTVCEVRVVESTLSRSVLTAFDWLTPRRWPTKNVGTLTEALSALRPHLGRLATEAATRSDLLR